jgi:hypothetical protein
MPFGGSTGNTDAINNNTPGIAYDSSNNQMHSQVRPFVFNGTTWDRLRGSTAGLTVAPTVDGTTSGTITAGGQRVSLALNGYSGASLTLTGTWSATLKPQISYDSGTTWIDTQMLRASWEDNEAIGRATISANVQQGILVPGGASHVSVTTTSFASGTVNVALRATTARSIQPLIGRSNGSAEPSAPATNGDLQMVWLDNAGAVVSTVHTSNAASADDVTNSTQLPQNAIGGNQFYEQVRPFVFNGTTWDRIRGNTSGAFVQGPFAGDTAMGAITTFNPVIMGGRAGTPQPTAVGSDGDAQALWLNRNGAVIIGGRAYDFLPTAATGSSEAIPLWLTLNGAVNVQTAPPATSKILAGHQSFTSTTAATTVITVPADATWEGVITINCTTAIDAASTTAGQATGVVTVAGAGATPTAGTYLHCDARAGANAAAGTVGSNSTQTVSIPFVLVAGAGAAATIQFASTNAGTFSRASCSVAGRITAQTT